MGEAGRGGCICGGVLVNPKGMGMPRPPKPLRIPRFMGEGVAIRFLNVSGLFYHNFQCVPSQ
jgi:hypothetical protein